jgi:hypothetical protein
VTDTPPELVTEISKAAQAAGVPPERKHEPLR